MGPYSQNNNLIAGKSYIQGYVLGMSKSVRHLSSGVLQKDLLKFFDV